MNGKRIVDLVGAVLALVLAAPVFLVVALVVRFSMGSPVFFRQHRPGLNGRTFELIKFRTMSDARDANGAILPDSTRLSRVGKTLRATSLDELPELWNVIKGDMSLVGPRPLLSEYLPLYTPVQCRRHDVRPGLTGWAQVNGRNSLTWEQKLALDVWYVDNRSCLLDLQIMLLTVYRVLRSDGIAQHGHVTAEKFRGSQR